MGQRVQCGFVLEYGSQGNRVDCMVKRSICFGWWSLVQVDMVIIDAQSLDLLNNLEVKAHGYNVIS